MQVAVCEVMNQAQSALPVCSSVIKRTHRFPDKRLLLLAVFALLALFVCFCLFEVGSSAGGYELAVYQQ